LINDKVMREMPYRDDMLGWYGNADDWGARMVAGQGRNVDIAPTVALFAIQGTATVVGFAIAIKYWPARILVVVIHLQDGCFRCTPGWQLPRDTGEAFDIESLALPFAAWLPGAVECT